MTDVGMEGTIIYLDMWRNQTVQRGHALADFDWQRIHCVLRPQCIGHNTVTKNRPSQIIPLYFNPRSRMGNDHCSLTYSTNANFTNSVLVHVTLNLLVVD